MWEHGLIVPESEIEPEIEPEIGLTIGLTIGRRESKTVNSGPTGGMIEEIRFETTSAITIRGLIFGAAIKTGLVGV